MATTETNLNMGTATIPPVPVVPGSPSVSPSANIADVSNPLNLKGNLQTPPNPPVPTNDVATYAQLAQQALTNQQNQVNPAETAYTSIIDKYKQAQAQTEGKNAYTQDVSNQQGLQGKTQAVQDIINQITTQDAANKQAQIGYGLNVGGVTTSSQQAFNAESDRANTVKQLGLGASLAAAQGNLAVAQNFVDKAVSAKFDDAEKKLTNLKDYLAINKSELERLDKKAYDQQTTLLNAKVKDLEVDKKNFSDIQTMLVNASSQNAPASLIEKAKLAKTPGEAAMILGQYAGDFYRTELLKAQIAKQKADTAKTYQETRAGNGSMPNIGDAANSVNTTALNTILGSGKFTKDQARSISNAINNGEDPFTVIKNNAKNIMGQTEATKLTNYEAVKSSMTDLKKSINDYYAAGGDTGIFTGNLEKVTNKFGEVKDPKLAQLAVEVQSQLQSYRNSISGTAYSDQEGKDIASVFPGINKTKQLNDSIFAGRDKALDASINGIYKSALGEKTYNSLLDVSKPKLSPEEAAAKSLLDSAQTVEQKATNPTNTDMAGSLMQMLYGKK